MGNFDDGRGDYRQNNIRHLRNKRPSIAAYFAVGLIGAIIGGFIMAAIAPYYIYGKILPFPGNTRDATREQQMAQPIVLNPADNITVASAVARKVMPSVVGISTVTIERDVFGKGKRLEGIGSGVIVHTDGYILTNSHVVTQDPSRITVYFMDGKELHADLLWQDVTLDLAVIKVDARNLNLTAAALGDSDNVLVGETAIAIGNPLGLRYERTVTQGIISGLNRSIWLSETELMEDLIQTDAAINPGNSGGPLINSSGEIIGINTVKAATAEGLGFAIPINVTKPVVRKFAETGEFVPTYMGIKLLDSEFANIYYPEVDLKRGILITEVISNAPAEQGGLRSKDILTHIDNIEINTMLKFKSVLYAKNPNDRVVVRYLRGGKIFETEITLQAKPRETR